jgi:hypothetical protein
MRTIIPLSAGLAAFPTFWRISEQGRGGQSLSLLGGAGHAALKGFVPLIAPWCNWRRDRTAEGGLDGFRQIV